MVVLTDFLKHSLGRALRARPQRDGPWTLWTHMIYYEQGFCLTKFGAPFFCFPFKDHLHLKSFGAAISFLQHQMFRRVWLDEVFSSSFKTICCKKFFWKETFIIKLSWTTFFWTKFFGWRKYFQTRFSGFPDQPDPENRMLPSWANPWAKRSSTAPQAWGSVQPIRQLACDLTPILIRW